MGLNYLLYRHQVSLMRATAAPSAEVRRAHQGFVAAYAATVDRIAEATGAAAAPLRRG